jgi:hypothetical protein
LAHYGGVGGLGGGRVDGEGVGVHVGVRVGWSVTLGGLGFADGEVRGANLAEEGVSAGLGGLATRSIR